VYVATNTSHRRDSSWHKLGWHSFQGMEGFMILRCNNLMQLQGVGSKHNQAIPFAGMEGAEDGEDCRCDR